MTYKVFLLPPTILATALVRVTQHTTERTQRGELTLAHSSEGEDTVALLGQPIVGKCVMVGPHTTPTGSRGFWQGSDEDIT